MKRLLVGCALTLLFGACGAAPVDANNDGIADGVRDPDSVSQVAPTTPVGTVSGRVTNSKFQAIEGAEVVMVLGGKSDGAGSSYKANTDAEGNFAFQNVPAGSSCQLYVTKAGYTLMRTTTTVPASTGQFPLNDGNANVGNVVLLELNGSIRFNVYSSSGKPAVGVKALLEVTPSGFVATAGGTYGSQWGVTSFSGTVDAQGVLSFSNVPSPEEMSRVQGTSTAYTLTLSGWDEEGDGSLESLGTVAGYSGMVLFTRGTQSIFLSDALTTAAVSITNSNVESLPPSSNAPFRNALKSTEPIYVVFNQPVIESTLAVKVVKEDCATDEPVTRALRNGNVLVITPGTAWATGAEYNITIRATGLGSGTTATRTGFFFGADPAAPRQLGTSAGFLVTKASFNTNTLAVESGDTVTINFDTPITFTGGSQARLFYNYDINNNLTIGGMGDSGEYGSPFNTGFGISANEPQFDPMNSTFTCTASGYTTRYAFTAFVPRPDGVPFNTPVKVIFAADTSATFGYRTIWGDSFVGEVSGTLALAP